MYGIIPPKLAASKPAFSACRPGKSKGAEFRIPAIRLMRRDQQTHVAVLSLASEKPEQLNKNKIREWRVQRKWKETGEKKS